MARVGVKDEPITYDDVKGVLDASQTVVSEFLGRDVFEGRGFKPSVDRRF